MGLVPPMKPPDSTEEDAPERPAGAAEEDTYLDGPYLVVTAAYHLKRGFCCNSNCRHCPYKEQPD